MTTTHDVSTARTSDVRSDETRPDETRPDETPDTQPSPHASPAPDRGAAAAETGSYRDHLWATAALLGIGTGLSLLNSSIAASVYSEIQKEFGVSNVDIEWVTTAARLCQCLMIPLTTWLADRFGLRRIFLVSMVLYAVTSALCAISPDFTSLVAFRILQAVPGAWTPIIGMMFLAKLIPKDKLPIAMTLFASIIVLAPGFTPLAGGYLGLEWSWRLVFLIAVPLSLVGLVGGAELLPDLPRRADRRFDLPGYLCVAVGLSALLTAATQGEKWGWTSHGTLGVLALGLDALALFVFVELRAKDPLLDLRIFQQKPYVIGLLVIDIIFTGLFLVLAAVPSFVQQTQQLSPINSGLLMVPQAVAWMLSIPLAVIINGRFGGRWLTVVGLAVVGGSTMMLARINVDLPWPELMALLSVRSFGTGLAMIPVLSGGLASLAPAMIPDGMWFRLVVQRVATAIGTAVLTALVSLRRTEEFAARSALLTPENAANNPQISTMQQEGPGGLIPLWQQLHGMSSAAAYSDVFLISGALTFLAIVLVLVDRGGRPAKATASTVVARA